MKHSGANPDRVDEHLFDYIGTLSEKEQKILKLRYGLDSEKPTTLTEVARIFDCTPSYISYCQQRALKKLKHEASHQKPSLQEYLDMLERYINIFKKRLDDLNEQKLTFDLGFYNGLNLAKDMFEECIKEGEDE